MLQTCLCSVHRQVQPRSTAPSSSPYEVITGQTTDSTKTNIKCGINQLLFADAVCDPHLVQSG